MSGAITEMGDFIRGDELMSGGICPGANVRHSLQIDPSGASPFLNHNFS